MWQQKEKREGRGKGIGVITIKEGGKERSRRGKGRGGGKGTAKLEGQVDVLTVIDFIQSLCLLIYQRYASISCVMCISQFC